MYSGLNELLLFVQCNTRWAVQYLTLYIIPVEPELAMSTPTYDPFGTEPTYKSKLFLCQMGHKQKSVLAQRGRCVKK